MKYKDRGEGNSKYKGYEVELSMEWWFEVREVGVVQVLSKRMFRKNEVGGVDWLAKEVRV